MGEGRAEERSVCLSVCLFRMWKQVSRGTEGRGGGGGGGGGEAEGMGGVAAAQGRLTHGCDHTGGVVGGEREAGGRVHGCGGGQHVAGVREGGEGRHVAGQGGRAEGAALVHQALGEVVHAVLGLFALLGLAGHLPVPGLDAFLLHGQRSVNLLSKDRKDGRLVFRHEENEHSKGHSHEFTDPLMDRSGRLSASLKIKDRKCGVEADFGGFRET